MTDDDFEFVRMPIWAVQVHDERIVNYMTFEIAEQAGFPPDALIDDDYSRCQEEGLRLRSEGYGGVLAPSAALPGVPNLTLFGARVMSSWGRSTHLASEMAACVVAVGRPEPGLADRIRHFGQDHEGYGAYIDNAASDVRLTLLNDPHDPGSDAALSLSDGDDADADNEEVASD
jgi:hypothetical protein